MTESDDGQAQAWRSVAATAYPENRDLFEGDASKFGFQLISITLSNGSRIKLQPHGVTLLVGANNSGKSTVLREATTYLAGQRHYPRPPLVSVHDVEVQADGTKADAFAWVASHGRWGNTSGQPGIVTVRGGAQHPYTLVAGWPGDGGTLGTLSNELIFYGDAVGRFGIGGTTEMRDHALAPATHPVHRLQDTRELMETVRAITREAFGLDLTLDTLGRQIRLRIGRIDAPIPTIDAVPSSYIEAMTQLPPLDEQGDGLRSFMGQILQVLAGAQPVVMIDEPEAFLHPPQAHALGLQLGRISHTSGRQVIMATHDRNLMSGLLESGVAVTVVRLSREGSHVETNTLAASDLGQLWADPVLRYTNTLDGLFHRLVVVAEAETDCAYLAAAFDCAGSTVTTVPPNEILFVPSGGRAGIAKICTALRAVGVSVIAAPDLDFLSDSTDTQRLVESLGGTWTDEHKRLLRVVSAGLTTAKPVIASEAAPRVAAILSNAGENRVDTAIRRAIADSLGLAKSGWTEIKKHGANSFLGDSQIAITSLLDLLAEVGIVPVFDGELERLAPEVAEPKGAAWLRAALNSGAQKNTRTQAHVARIIKAWRGSEARPDATPA